MVRFGILGVTSVEDMDLVDRQKERTEVHGWPIRTTPFQVFLKPFEIFPDHPIKT